MLCGVNVRGGRREDRSGDFPGFLYAATMVALTIRSFPLPLRDGRFNAIPGTPTFSANTG